MSRGFSLISEDHTHLIACCLFRANYVVNCRYDSWVTGKDWGCHPEDPGKFSYAPGPEALRKKLEEEASEKRAVAAAEKMIEKEKEAAAAASGNSSPSKRECTLTTLIINLSN